MLLSGDVSLEVGAVFALVPPDLTDVEVALVPFVRAGDFGAAAVDALDAAPRADGDFVPFVPVRDFRPACASGDGPGLALFLVGAAPPSISDADGAGRSFAGILGCGIAPFVVEDTDTTDRREPPEGGATPAPPSV